MSQHYRHSGSAPLFGVALTLLAGLTTAAVGGAIYDYAIVWIPFVYINFFLSIGFGGLIGWVISAVARWGHIRNGMIVNIIGLICGVVGLYVAWCVDAKTRGALPSPPFFEPDLLSAYISAFYELGAWTIGKHGPNVSGKFLGFVWGLEALFIVGASTLLPGGVLSKYAYCEDCGVWCEHQNDVQRLAATDLETTIAKLNDGDLRPLAGLERVPAEAVHYLKLDLLRCPSCTNSNYLDVTEVTITVDKDGDKKESTTEHVEKLLVSPSDIPKILEAGHPPTADSNPSPQDENAPADVEFQDPQRDQTP